MKLFLRKSFVALLAPAFLLLPSLAASQGQYPTKPIRLIVPYPPGGSSDIIARLIAQKLGESLKTLVVVDNRPGADSLIGTKAVAAAPADGYTIGVVAQTIVLNRALKPQPDFDPLKDVKPVAMLVTMPYYVLVGSGAGAKAANVQELAAASKGPTGEMSYSTSSTAALVVGEMLKQAARLNARPIPYSGSMPSMTAVASGEVDFTLDTYLASKPLIDAGKLRALAVTAGSRTVQLPTVPTVSESGERFEVFAWFCLIAQAGLPPAIAERLNTEVNRALALVEVKQRFEALGATTMALNGPETDQFFRSETNRYAEVIQKAQIKSTP